MSLPRWWCSLVALVLLLGCGGGDSAVTEPPAGPLAPPPTPAFAISVSALTLPVVQGDSTTATVTVARSGGFTGPVALAVEGLPSGVTSRLATPTIAAGATNTTLTLTTARSAAPDTAAVTLRATASGLAPQSASLTLVVAERVAQLALRLRSPRDQLSTNRGGLPLDFDVILSQTDGTSEATLAVTSGLPTGVTASFSPPRLASGTSTVTFAADSTTTPGDYTAELRATAGNAAPAVLSVPFTILDESRLEAELAPPTLTVARNASGDANLTVAIFNTNQFLTVEASGLPTDVAVSFDATNIPITQAFYTVRFTVGPAAPLGVFPITITASAPGAKRGVDTLLLTVAPAPVGGSTVFRFCGPDDTRPLWFGIGRNGFSWTRVLPDAQGEYAFDVGIKTDVAWVTQHGPDDFAITVFSGSEAELSQFGRVPCAESTFASVTGQVVNLAASDSAQVAIGPRSTIAPITAVATGFTLLGRTDQPQDLLAVRRRVAAGSSTASVDRVFIRRALALTDGGSVGTIDFGSLDAFPSTAFTLSLDGVATDEVATVAATFETVGEAVIAMSTPAPGPTTVAAAAVPEQAMQPGDLHVLGGSAVRVSGNERISRHVWQRTRSPSNSSVRLGPTPEAPSLSLYASSRDRVRYQALMPEQPEYERLFSASWTQEVGSMRRTVRMTATEDVAVTQGTPTKRRLRAPEFDGASGWNSAWEPRPRTDMTWSVTVLGWDAIGGVAAPRGDGVVTRGYTWTGVLPVP